MSYRELLRTQGAFRRLWLGQVVSQGGDWLQFIALLALFPTRGAAVELLAGLFIVRMLPSIVWAPVAGVIADRYPRGRVMVACDIGRAVIVLGYLLVRGPEDIAWVYALMFAQESLTCIFEPARSASLPQIVERRALFAANSLAGATWSAMLAIGSAVGGAVTLLVGSHAAFLVDSLSFLVSALLIAGVPIPPVPRDAAELDAHARDRFGVHALRTGIAYLRAHSAQAAAALAKGLWGMSGGIIFLFSIYAGQIFTSPGGDASGATGILYAGRGFGALAGPLVARRIWGESATALRRGIQMGFPLAACAFAALTLAPNAAVAAALLVLAHAGGSTVWVNSTQLVQLTVPNALQGRVFAVELALLTSTMALSNAFAGAALARGLAGVHGVTFVMAAVAMVAGLVWALAMRRLGGSLDAAAAAKSRVA